MKREVKHVNATPNKRLFWSIISDYSLNTAICELIDNALDIWMKLDKSQDLSIVLNVDFNRQLINIKDNAGGVAGENLPVLVSPGASDNSPDEHIIGFFGVGSKRAVVALAEEIKILTRFKGEHSYQIDINEDWLGDESWEMPIYQIEDIDESTTIIDLSKLRIHLTEENVNDLRGHLCETYANFLKNDNFEILFNDIPLEPIEFDFWAYPPDYQPRDFMFNMTTEDNEMVGVEINAGLIRAKEPGKDDYGVYFYCNDRLIIKEVKDKEVGYITKIAGIPHSDASLARIIVRLYGSAKLMPWNSSKSAINFSHHVFKGLQDFLIPVVSDYSSLSRRLKGRWEEEVFAYPEGEMEYVDIHDITKVRRSYLPALPRTRKHLIDTLKNLNKSILEDKPWILGLLESIAMVDVIMRQKFETKNRVALILLDSSFEIALKEFILHTDNLNLGKQSLQQIFEHRDKVIKIVNQKVHIDTKTLAKIKHYYQQRNKLIHEVATVDVADSDITNYLLTIQKVLSKLFDLHF